MRLRNLWLRISWPFVFPVFMLITTTLRICENRARRKRRQLRGTGVR